MSFPTPMLQYGGRWLSVMDTASLPIAMVIGLWNMRASRTISKMEHEGERSPFLVRKSYRCKHGAAAGMVQKFKPVCQEKDIESQPALASSKFPKSSSNHPSHSPLIWANAFAFARYMYTPVIPSWGWGWGWGMRILSFNLAWDAKVIYTYLKTNLGLEN